MEKTIIFLMFFVLCFSVQGQEWIYQTKQIEVSVSVSSGLEIIPEESDYVVEEVGTQLYLFPREYSNQEVISLDIFPEAEVINDSLFFSWDDMDQNKFEFTVFGELKLEELLTKVKRKVAFPIHNLDEELIEYTLPQNKIDSDKEDIIALASSLVEGENDLFVAVFNIARWVEENIDYDLTTLTEKLSQKASWVLDNRYGVCDELTSLFIAMVRSLGIPARYVSGFAYTDWNNLNDFGSHAWAEVYFPDYGWVAFDLTYHEFGYVDVGHVKLMQSLDAGESSIKFNVLGRGIDIEVDELIIDVELNEKIGSILPKIAISAEVVEEEVSFGSHNLIKVEVENLEDYYVSTTLYVSNTTKLDIIGKNKQSVLLRPSEQKEIYWIVRVDEDLDEGFFYVLPIEIYTRAGERDSLNFTSKEDSTGLSFSAVSEMIEEAEEESEKIYSKKIELNCDANEFVYIGESVDIICNVKNNGNVYLEDIDVCVDDCVSIDLGISQEKAVEFTVLAKEGLKVRAQNEDVSKVFYLETDVLDFPELEIINLVFLEKVRYEDDVSLRFRLNKVSKSNPLDIKVDLDNIVGGFTIKELSQKQDLSFNLKGSDLNEGNNSLILKVEYTDKIGRSYLVEKEIVIELEKVSFFQKIIIGLNRINRVIEGLFT
ncbi:transglutaminase-like domain-containing protein [Candidatus Woesearchaeota archaeon]|nr:transglutaminase-like domain-containing protein [Candidatus Woesearchaeota archaeon]